MGGDGPTECLNIKVVSETETCGWVYRVAGGPSRGTYVTCVLCCAGLGRAGERRSTVDGRTTRAALGLSVGTAKRGVESEVYVGLGSRPTKIETLKRVYVRVERERGWIQVRS